MDSVADVLASLGLNDKETAVYLTLVALGTAPASEVAKRTQLPRSTVQFTCQQLQRRGVISMVQRKNVYLFSADDPRRLLTLVEFQQKMLERKREDAHRIIGELEQLRNPDTDIPRVRFYEGEEGVDAAWNSVLDDVKEGGEILGFVHPLDPSKDAGTPALGSFVERRMQKGVHMRTIATNSPMSVELRKRDGIRLRNSWLMETVSGGAPAEIMIYGAKICLVTVERGAIFATIIENRSIAELLRAIFEDHWNRLNRSTPS